MSVFDPKADMQTRKCGNNYRLFTPPFISASSNSDFGTNTTRFPKQSSGELGRSPNPVFSPIGRPHPFYLLKFRERQHENSSSVLDRKSTRLNSSHLGISYAVFCL